MTNDGWPVALPRFIRRPSDSTMIALPAGNVHTSTCGLTFLRSRRPRPRGRPCRSRCRSGRCCRGSRVLHPRHLVDGDDVLVAGRGDDDVGDVEDVVEGVDLVAVHRGLQRADRVDLGDDDAGALAAQRLRAALADVAVAADDRDLAADEDVGGAVDAVDERVAAAVLVVELRLGDRVVDVDGREEQRALLHHVVETQHAGGGLLGDALDLAGDRRPAVVALGERGVEDVEDDLLLVALGGGRVGRDAGLLHLDAEVDEQGGVATVVEDHVGEACRAGH